MNDLSLRPGVTAALGLDGADPAPAVLASLGPEAGLTVLPPEPLLEPSLTMWQNYRLVKRFSPPEKGEALARLLELSGLKTQGWDRTFRKDMDGERQLWKLMLTLAMSRGRVFLPRALEGLSGVQRERLDAMLAAWTEEGRAAVLTAGTVKEALALSSVRQLWLVRGERVLPLDRASAEACPEEETEEKRTEALWKEAER